MNIDKDLIRKILLSIKARTDREPRPVKIDGYDETKVFDHLDYLNDEGYIVAPFIHRSSQIGTGPIDQVLVKDMTAKGRELISAIENDTIWNKIKSAFKLKPEDWVKLGLPGLLALARSFLPG